MVISLVSLPQHLNDDDDDGVGDDDGCEDGYDDDDDGYDDDDDDLCRVAHTLSSVPCKYILQYLFSSTFKFTPQNMYL